MNKTIVALATPPGIGGLSVIRMSGEDSFVIADKVFRGRISIEGAKSHTIHYGDIVDGEVLLDKVTCSVYKEPNSYTGENVVEIGCHGGQIVANMIIELLMRVGATAASPGEFTRRAFINGKIDLTQVEAVADIIHSNTVAGVSTAARQLNGNFTNRLKNLRNDLLDIAGLLELELDFSDEGIELIPKEKIMKKLESAIDFCNKLSDSYKVSEILRSGYYVGIVGFPNSGKSTLFNKIIEKDRAIVSNIPGTTRDYIEEDLFIKDMTVRLVDTAGIREATNTIEIEGIRLVDTILEQSNLILIINDISISRNNSEKLIERISNKYINKPIVIAHNKIDCIGELPAINNNEVLISAIENRGIEELKTIIYKYAKSNIDRESDILVNQRHSLLLKEASMSLEVAKQSLTEGYENEFIAIDVRKAVKILGELTGETWNEEVLEHIFTKFCIGK